MATKCSRILVFAGAIAKAKHAPLWHAARYIK